MTEFLHDQHACRGVTVELTNTHAYYELENLFECSQCFARLTYYLE